MRVWQSPLLVAGVLLAAQVARADSTTQLLMRQKLESIHGVLDGLALADFGKIATNAGVLQNVARATTWHKSEQPEFLKRSESFQESAGYLVEQANAKNLDGVAMGYMRVVLDCMKCHATVRGAAKKP